MANSTKPPQAAKPEKPYPNFPLYPHRNGQWAKKIRQKTYYFGPWPDWNVALERYEAEQDKIAKGEPIQPLSESASLTVGDLFNEFLNAKRRLVERGIRSPRTLHDYRRTCDAMVEVFGDKRPVASLGPADFEKLLGRKATGSKSSQNSLVVRCSVPFNWAASKKRGKERIEEVDFGESFVKYSKADVEEEIEDRGYRKDFTRKETLALLETATQPLKSMVLLGINVGFGNNDCSTLTLNRLDIENGWHEHRRPKTKAKRRAKLWPETIESIREWLEVRPEASDEKDAELVFLTTNGRPWVDGLKNSVTDQFTKLLKAADVEVVKLRGFYGLRFSFRTQADEVLDDAAIDCVMGHKRSDMGSHYRQSISDERLQRVSDQVHGWLFGGQKND
ncbi:MAG: phage integrase family protein [Planctomycetes bacterium]|nr:phage integrase family protein [Planctomycetota bacterium]